MFLMEEQEKKLRRKPEWNKWIIYLLKEFKAIIRMLTELRERLDRHRKNFNKKLWKKESVRTREYNK